MSPHSWAEGETTGRFAGGGLKLSSTLVELQLLSAPVVLSLGLPSPSLPVQSELTSRLELGSETAE